MPDEPDIPSLLTALTDSNPGVRLGAAMTLAPIGGHSDVVLPVLVDDVGAVDEARAWQWQYALSQFSDRGVIAVARKASEESFDRGLRIKLLRTLCCEIYQHHGSAFPWVEPLTSHPDPEIAGWASVILTKPNRGGRYAVRLTDGLLAAAASEDFNLRRQALNALHWVEKRPAEEQRAKRAAFPSLTHADADVRHAAYNAIRERQLDESDAAQLVAMAGDGPIDAIVKLIAALPTLPTAARDLLVQSVALQRVVDEASELIYDAFRRLGPAAVAPLLEIASDVNRPEFQRCAAISALSRIHPLSEMVIARLSKIVENEAGAPRINAGIALSLQGQRSVNVVAAAVEGLTTGNWRLVESTKGALAKLDAEVLVPALIRTLDSDAITERHEIADLLSRVAWRSPEAAAAAIRAVSRTEDIDQRRRMGLNRFEELAVPPALETLAHGSKDEIIRVLDILQSMGRRVIDAVPGLVPLLQHPDRQIVFAAAQALAMIDPSVPGIIGPLVEALRSELPRDRYSSLNVLEWVGEHGGPAVPRLIELIDDPRFASRAILDLGRMGSVARAAVPRLIEEALHGTNSPDALTALGRIRAEEAVEPLLGLLDNEAQFTQVVMDLGQMGAVAAPAVPRLQAMLAGPLRIQAVEGLKRLGPVSAPAVDDLTRLLDDSDREMRRAACSALGSIGAAAAPAGLDLLRLAREEDPDLRRDALLALGGPRPAEAISYLGEIAASDNPTLADAAISTLSRYGDQIPADFVPLLVRRFDEAALQGTIVLAVKDLGPRAAPLTDKLIGFAVQENFSEWSVEALESIGPGAASGLPVLERRLRTTTEGADVRPAIWAISPQRAAELGLRRYF